MTTRKTKRRRGRFPSQHRKHQTFTFTVGNRHLTLSYRWLQLLPGAIITLSGLISFMALINLAALSGYGNWLSWLLGQAATIGVLLTLVAGIWMLAAPKLPPNWQPDPRCLLGGELLFIALLMGVQITSGWQTPSLHGERAGSSGWLLTSTLYAAIGPWSGSALFLAIIISGIYLCWHYGPIRIQWRKLPADKTN